MNVRTSMDQSEIPRKEITMDGVQRLRRELDDQANVIQQLHQDKEDLVAEIAAIKSATQDARAEWGRMYNALIAELSETDNLRCAMEVILRAHELGILAPDYAVRIANRSMMALASRRTS